ncbi:N-acetyltransferase [Bacillus sp. Marseille-Q3570]|uniref:GNAT family N-acetyltransferase n=1 Tax=Bacillus sp. Marseille-Q3570 TaxID=2963522 RepID=UPI0021B83FC3|nr:GNAT family N-acetyltransferase [Bacillus sp. Marseille-Q3570]
MIQVRKAVENDLEIISSFIADRNRFKEHHIGYCGVDVAEIKYSLKHDFDDIPFEDSFVVASKGQEVVGIIGMDIDLQEKHGEVWGPFIKMQKKEWQAVAEDMWNYLMRQTGKHVKKISHFSNVENELNFAFAESLGFKKRGEHTVLRISPDQIRKDIENTSITEMTRDYIDEMVKLHESYFPNAYIDGKQIIGILNANNKVFICAEQNTLKGYIFVETNPEVQEGSIEFFAVGNEYRKNGIGRSLLLHALKWMFMNAGMAHIQLCVNSESSGAINLYRSIGFEVDDELNYFDKFL